MPGGDKYFELRKALLDSTLVRSVQTKDLWEPATATRSRVRFKNTLVNDYKWLIMGDHGGFCIWCKLFCSDLKNPGELTAKPYLTFSKKNMCESHSKTKYHINSVALKTRFLAVASGSAASIQHQVQSHSLSSHAVKARRLHAVCQTLVSLVKQNMPLRGHRNEKDNSLVPQTITVNGDTIIKGDVNPGNFLYFLQFRADAGDTDVSAILNDRSHYVHHSVQNELLDIMASQVLENIVATVSKTFYSIIADETTDASTNEQLCVAIRYPVIKDEEVNIEERFLQFVKVASVTGELNLCWEVFAISIMYFLYLNVILITTTLGL